MKVCTKCGEDKPLSEYYKRKASKDGLTASCKSCVKAANKAYHEANREKLAAYHKAHYEANRERIAAREKAYREENREKIAAQKKAYYEANREKIAAQKKSYNEANRELIQERNRAFYERNSERLIAYQRTRYYERREEVLEQKQVYYEENRDRISEYRKSYYEENKHVFIAGNIRRKRLLADAVQEPYTREEIFERDNWTCQLCQEPIDPDLRHPESGSASIDHIIPISLGGDDTPANVQAAHLTCNQRKHNRVELEDPQAA